jgi:hypothetical protein
VSAAAAAYIATTVESANLDEQPVQLIGEYLTVSSVQSWLIRQDGGETIMVKGVNSAKTTYVDSGSGYESTSKRS